MRPPTVRKKATDHPNTLAITQTLLPKTSPARPMVGNRGPLLPLGYRLLVDPVALRECPQARLMGGRPLKSVPKICDVTARTLLAQLPKLGTIVRHQIATLVGIAPINRDSNLMRDRRFIAGGRTSVRGVLYMAALTAIRRDSPFRSFYERLTQRGLPKKVALVAVMRKLLVTFIAIVRDRTPGRSITA